MRRANRQLTCASHRLGLEFSENCTRTAPPSPDSVRPRRPLRCFASATRCSSTSLSLKRLDQLVAPHNKHSAPPHCFSVWTVARQLASSRDPHLAASRRKGVSAPRYGRSQRIFPSKSRLSVGLGLCNLCKWGSSGAHLSPLSPSLLSPNLPRSSSTFPQHGFRHSRRPPLPRWQRVSLPSIPRRHFPPSVPPIPAFSFSPNCTLASMKR